MRKTPPRKPIKRHPSPALVVVGVRLTEAERDAIDREVRRLRTSSPAAGHASRSSVIRALVARLRRSPVRSRRPRPEAPKQAAAAA